MQKSILFPLIIFLEIIAMMVIKAKFDLETTNTLFAAIGICVINATFLVFLITGLLDYKKKYPDWKSRVITIIKMPAP